MNSAKLLPSGWCSVNRRHEDLHLSEVDVGRGQRRLADKDSELEEEIAGYGLCPESRIADPGIGAFGASPRL